MEQDNQNQPKPAAPPNPPSGAGVMDVQPPQSQSPAPAAPGIAPAPRPVQPPATPVAEQPKPGLSPELLAQAEAETKKPDVKQDVPKQPKKKGPILVIGIAVVVSLALAGVSVYAYLQSQKPADTHGTANQEDGGSTPQNQTAPATGEEIEDMSKELDETINAAPEGSELPSDGLSEEAVGL